MTYDEAAKRCSQQNRESDGQRQWFTRQVSPGDWQVVFIAAPGRRRVGPLTQTIPSKRPVEPIEPSRIPPYPGFVC